MKSFQASNVICGIFQWGELKHSGTKEDCERIARRWTEQNGNVDIEVIPLPNAEMTRPEAQ